jgi:FtsH-binding integral membrane protein
MVGSPRQKATASTPLRLGSGAQRELDEALQEPKQGARPDDSEPAVNENKRSLRPVLGALALGMGLPVALALVLNSMRPDLIAPMLDHEFGYRLVLVERLLCVGATALYLVAALVRFKSHTPKVLVVVAGVLFFTLPALLGILFGPIVFAFTHGAPQ